MAKLQIIVNRTKDASNIFVGGKHYEITKEGDSILVKKGLARPVELVKEINYKENAVETIEASKFVSRVFSKGANVKAIVSDTFGLIKGDVKGNLPRSQANQIKEDLSAIVKSLKKN